MRELKLTVGGDRPTTLQSFLSGQKGVSRRLLTRLKRQENGITRGGIQIRSIDTVFPGDEIVLRFEDSGALEPNPELRIPVIYETERLVIFDKPAGVPVHPSIKHQGDTLGNFFAHLYPDLTFRPVNRLDKDTSGLCIVAKDAHAASLLQGSCRKVYCAAVEGWQDIDGERYYFGSDNKMKSGWQTIDGRQYYFENGALVRGVFNEGGKLRAIGNEGYIQEGWIIWNNRQYYTDSEGVPITDTSRTIDGVLYTFDKYGAATRLG